MRKLLYILIVIGVLVLPVRPTDVGELEPIQAVWLSSKNGTVTLETDTEDKGTGKTVAEALEDMKCSSPGIVYLDTAQFLLVSENAVERIPEIQLYLKDAVQICLWEGEASVADAAAYMQAHKIGVRLNRWHTNVKLPNLPLK